MAKESVTEFFQAVSQNQALQEKLEAVNPQNCVKIAEEHGYSFTVEELEEQLQAGDGELSDEQLEAVTGGVFGPFRNAGPVKPWPKKPIIH